MFAYLFIAFISLFFSSSFLPGLQNNIHLHMQHHADINHIIFNYLHYILHYIYIIIFIISLYLDLSYISSFSLASQIDVFGVIIIHGLQNIMHSHLETYTDHIHILNYIHIIHSIIWYILFFHLIILLSLASRIDGFGVILALTLSGLQNIIHSHTRTHTVFTWSLIHFIIYYIIHIHLYSLFTYYIQVHLHNYSISQIYSVNSTSSLLSILCIRSLFDYYIHNLLIYTLLYT